MGLFGSRKADRLELERLREQMKLHHQRFEAAEHTSAELEQRLDAVDHSNLTLAQQLGPVAELNEQVKQLQERIVAIAARVGELDARITSTSTELANQISELSSDIESVRKAADTEPASNEGVDPALLDALEESQERLANEQARYQIAFRADLARLADELHRAIRT